MVGRSNTFYFLEFQRVHFDEMLLDENFEIPSGMDNYTVSKHREYVAILIKDEPQTYAKLATRYINGCAGHFGYLTVSRKHRNWIKKQLENIQSDPTNGVSSSTRFDVYVTGRPENHVHIHTARPELASNNMIVSSSAASAPVSDASSSSRPELTSNNAPVDVSAAFPSVNSIKTALNKCSKVMELNREFCKFLFEEEIVTIDSQHFISLEENLMKLGSTPNCTAGVFYSMSFECPGGIIYNRIFESGNCRGFYVKHFHEFCNNLYSQQNSNHQGTVVWETSNHSDIEVQKEQEASKPQKNRPRPHQLYNEY